MNIITAGTQHIPIIQAITHEVWPPTYVPIIGEAQVSYMLGLFYTTEALTQQMTTAGHRFLLAYLDGQPVAFASFSEISPAIFKLHKLYTLLGTQGRGVGSGLVKHITGLIATEHGPAELRLNVNIHNRNAIAFYTKYGFSHLADENIDIGGGYFMNDYVLCLVVGGI